MSARAGARAAGRCAGPGHQTERGGVTAELAVALPAVVLLLMTILGAAVVGRVQVECADAARVAARQASLGASAGEVRQVALSALAREGTVSIDAGGEWVRVRVSSPVDLVLGDLVVSGEAAAVAEPQGPAPVVVP